MSENLGSVGIVLVERRVARFNDLGRNAVLPYVANLATVDASDNDTSNASVETHAVWSRACFFRYLYKLVGANHSFIIAYA